MADMQMRMGNETTGPLPSPDWADLRLFLEVARTGSFSAAGRKLGLEQSTVSRRMAAFEERLGTAVFDRLPSGTALTALGAEMKRHAEGMEAHADELMQRISGHEREAEGLVRLALTESIAVYGVIPRVLPRLAELHPRLSIQLLTSYEVADLGHREADLALRFFRPTSGDLVTARVVTLPTALIAHRRWLGTELARLPLIGVSLGHLPALENDWLAHHLPQPPRFVVSSYVGQIEAVRAGLGASLMARSALAMDPQLVELEGVPRGPELELWLVTPRSLRRVPRVAAVWHALHDGLGFLAGAP
ncbi:MAG TPA: LysR family transcriptional regulator [Polyangiaceae bacterium]|nr:LysR family transcriptional regulator [Polyangiaceae bacterium]